MLPQREEGVIIHHFAVGVPAALRKKKKKKHMRGFYATSWKVDITQWVVVLGSKRQKTE